MPDAYTPILGLTLPEVGASRDTWGSKMNANMQTLDQRVAITMPIGAVMDFAGTQAPPGWLICDGRLISRVTYAALFAVIGTVWGVGDGSTTFALPPTPGRSTVGPGAVTDDAGATITFAFAQLRGAVARPITQANLPVINMVTDGQGSHAHNAWTGGGGSHAHTTDTQGYHGHGGYANDHTHPAAMDAQGHHQHNVGLWGLGTGAAPGGYGVISDAFGGRAYPTDGAGSHTHNVWTGGSGNIGISIYGDGNHAHNVYAVGDHTHAVGVDTQGWHQHNVTLGGSGVWFDNMQPVLVMTKIIYAGPQAAPLVEGQAVQPQRLLSAPSRGMH